MNALAKVLLDRVIIPIALKVVKEMMTPANYQKYGDKLFDLLEAAIADSTTKLDDRLLLPIIKSARVLMGIPDLPDIE